MGALRRTGRRPRGTRAAAVAVLALLGTGGIVACEPGGLGSASVAYTTDRTATAELERRHVDVRWLTCTGHYRGDRTPAAGKTPSPTESTVVLVDCQGQTRDDRKITVTGRVTRAVDGACVRGDLTATVGGKQWFHVSGLGNCDATPSPVRVPSATYRPSGGQPAPTVTVTRTVWCGDPSCRPVEGK